MSPVEGQEPAALPNGLVMRDGTRMLEPDEIEADLPLNPVDIPATAAANGYHCVTDMTVPFEYTLIPKDE